MVENLRLYLESNEIQIASNGGFTLPKGNETHQIPIFLGRRFKEMGDYKHLYNTGGPGYVLNKAGLKSLIVESIPYWDPYFVHRRTATEDVMVSKVLQEVRRVFPFYTLDENHGQRFTHFRVSIIRSIYSSNYTTFEHVL